MKKVKTREKYLQSIEEPNYKLGILFLFPISPTSNLQELKAKIAALEQQLEVEMAKNVSNNVSAQNNTSTTGGDALSNTDGGNVPLYKRQSFNQENANDRVAFGLLVGQHHYGAGGMYISFTKNDEGLPRLKSYAQ